MLLGEWWVANPTDDDEAYEPPSDRVPGVLREIANGEYVLETIGFLGDQPFLAGGSGSLSATSRLDIWGTDRDGTCYSLLNNIRVNSTWRMPHAAAGHEDWAIGWLAKGNAWVTPDEECSSARIRIDDLHPWALYGRPDNFEFDQDSETARINLRRETLGTTTIDNTQLSLIRAPHTSWGSTGQDSGREITSTDLVPWKIGGPLALQTIIKEWNGHLEAFVRFMTMEPSVVTHIDCHLGGSGNQRQDVELIAPRVQRDDRTAEQARGKPSPYDYLATLHTLQQRGIDPTDVFAGYWQRIVTGDAYMAMQLHLESQDRLLDRSSDSALLNAIRSVESLWAANNPSVQPHRLPGGVRAQIDDAIARAGHIGTEILDAWPDLNMVHQLRRHVAHGKGRPDASFGLRCVGGAKALQWILRVQLLSELGIHETVARSIVSDSRQYPLTLDTLKRWSAELASRPAP